MKKILITGATGLMGASLAPFLLDQKNLKIITHGLSKPADINGNLADFHYTQNLLNRIKPDIIINLVALTDVDFCEENPHQAYVHNAKPVENISRWMQKNSGCHLIHISTDQVYNGGGIHKEYDITLSNIYAYSKYCAELVACNISATILRINFFGKSKCIGRSSFSDWLLDSLTKRMPIKLFTDILFSPLLLETLTEIILLVIRDPKLGTFNVGSKNGMSKCDFAYYLASIFDLSTEHCTEVRRDSSFFKTYRPGNMMMDCSHFESAYNTHLPDLKDEIDKLKLF
jgi:dTDP-4-dehydrorhamnose reductase